MKKPTRQELDHKELSLLYDLLTAVLCAPRRTDELASLLDNKPRSTRFRAALKKVCTLVDQAGPTQPTFAFRLALAQLAKRGSNVASRAVLRSLTGACARWRVNARNGCCSCHRGNDSPGPSGLA